MTVTYELADIETPTHFYRRAHVVIDDNNTATVSNFQTSEVLLVVENMVSQNNDQWTNEDNTITITKDPRCGTCGSKKRTQVIPR